MCIYEDKAENMLNHGHNAHLKDYRVKRVNNWHDICNELIGVN